MCESPKKSKGVNGVLPYEAQRANTGGCAVREGVRGGARLLKDFSVLWGLQVAFSATLLRVNSCWSPSICQLGCWTAVGLSTVQSPDSQLAPWSWAGGYQLCMGVQPPDSPPTNSHPDHFGIRDGVKGATLREIWGRLRVLWGKPSFFVSGVCFLTIETLVDFDNTDVWSVDR